MRYTELSQTKAPVPPPVNLDVGRLDLGRAALSGAFVLGSLLAALAGLWTFGRASNGLVQFAGVVAALVAMLLGGIVLYISVREWLDHRRRVEEWHAASLATWRELQGATTTQTVSEWELSADNPAHVLLAALMVHLRVEAGSDLAYSVRQMVGPMFLAGRRVGNLSKLSAETMGRRFGQLGLIAGRGERQAGEWVPRSADDVLELLARNW